MYFPKSQIKTNLYSNGEYIYLNTSEPYIGPYYKLSNGKTFTGISPNDPPNFEIELSPDVVTSEGKIFNIDPVGPESSVSPPTNINYIVSDFFYFSSSTQDERNLPPFFTTLPTPQNYEEGKMIRYFTKKTNELIYKEISKETHDKLKSRDESIAWDLYEPQKIEWVISNTPINFALRDNKTAVMKIEQKQKWYGFSKFLKEDYTKYYSRSHNPL